MSSASRWRPDFQQMIEDARRGQFDVVVAESLDRLSRDQEDLPHLYKQLAFVGVRMFTLSEGWITEGDAPGSVEKGRRRCSPVSR